jgi:hypothetical protein
MSSQTTTVCVPLQIININALLNCKMVDKWFFSLRLMNWRVLENPQIKFTLESICIYRDFGIALFGVVRLNIAVTETTC